MADLPYGVRLAYGKDLQIMLFLIFFSQAHRNADRVEGLNIILALEGRLDIIYHLEYFLELIHIYTLISVPILAYWYFMVNDKLTAKKG